MAVVANGLAAGERAAAGKPVRASFLLKTVVVLIGVFVLAHDVDTWRHAASVAETGAGQALGIAKVPPPASNCTLDGWCGITALTPRGPLAATGARQGDQYRFDRSLDYVTNPRAGTPIGVTLRRRGAVSHAVVKAALHAGHSPQLASLAVAELSFASVCLAGMFLALFGGGRVSTLLYGAALVCGGIVSFAISPAESDPWLAPVVVVVITALGAATSPLMLAFAVVARREAAGKASRAWNLTVIALAGAQVVEAGYRLWSQVASRSPIAIYRGVWPGHT
jgi:hypothetical protein